MTDPRQLPHLIDLLDDESPLVRHAVIRELTTFGPDIYNDLSFFPIELTPQKRRLLNTVLQGPRRCFLKREWPEWFVLSDDQARLEKALTLLSEYQSGLEFKGRLGYMLDELAGQYRQHHSQPDVRALAEFLFKQKAFVGANDDYYNPQNSNLVSVIKNRRGIPISLACVYMLVGRRLGLNIRGCNSPRHFLAIVENENKKHLVDCFHAGEIVGEKEIATLSRERSLTVEDALKLEADSSGIIRRILGNLIFAYQQIEMETESYFMVHLLKEIQLFHEGRERGKNAAQQYDFPDEVDLYVPGQKIKHLSQGYRGIIVDYDLYCIHGKESSGAYHTEPDRNQPWYRILIDETQNHAYVPHSQVIQDTSRNSVDHPLVSQFFDLDQSGEYVRNSMPWLD